MKIDFLKKNLLKRNQIVIYAIALLLVTAGYLNFTSLNDTQETASLETEESNISIEEAEENSKVADIGDAALVNSNDIVKEDSNSNTPIADAISQEITENTTNQTNNTVVKETATTVSSSDDYFTKSKLERDTMYSQMLEAYEKILNSSNSSETQRQTATTEIAKINETKNSIMVCENLIGTKGFTKNIVFVNGESVNVIIGTKQLKQEEIAQIQNIVSREMKAEIENIHIAMK